MNCKGALARLTAYQQGELTPGLAAQVEGHLQACVRCRETFALLAAAGSELRALAADYQCPPVSLHPPTLSPVRAPGRRWAWVGALTALVALAGLGVQQAYRGRPGTTPHHFSTRMTPPRLAYSQAAKASPAMPRALGAPRQTQTRPTSALQPPTATPPAPVQPAAGSAPGLTAPARQAISKFRLGAARPLTPAKADRLVAAAEFAATSSQAVEKGMPAPAPTAPLVSQGQDTAGVPEPASGGESLVMAPPGPAPAPAPAAKPEPTEDWVVTGAGTPVPTVARPSVTGALRADGPAGPRGPAAQKSGRTATTHTKARATVPGWFTPAAPVAPLQAAPAPLGVASRPASTRAPSVERALPERAASRVEAAPTAVAVQATAGTHWTVTLRVSGRMPGGYAVTTTEPGVTVAPSRTAGEFTVTVPLARNVERVALAVANSHRGQPVSYWLYLPLPAGAGTGQPARDALAALATAEGCPLLSSADGPVLIGGTPSDRLLQTAGWRLQRGSGVINAFPPAGR